MSRLPWAAAGVTLTLLACGPRIRVTQLGNAYPPRADDAQVIVSSLQVPTCPFDELGLVTVRETGFARGAVVLEAVKREARRMGGHAVIGLHDVPATPDSGPGLSGTVVRFTDPACREMASLR